MTIATMQELLMHKLGMLYTIETEIIKALPKMISAANDEALEEALTTHLDVTKEQLSRLESIAHVFEFEKKGIPCEGIVGILSDGEKSLKEITDPAVKDAAIIGAAAQVEHYEMATYEAAVHIAQSLDLGQIVDELKVTLGEEKKTAADLSTLATGGLFMPGLNDKAVNTDD